jgi:hypothetical protein
MAGLSYNRNKYMTRKNTFINLIFLSIFILFGIVSFVNAGGGSPGGPGGDGKTGAMATGGYAPAADAPCGNGLGQGSRGTIGRGEDPNRNTPSTPTSCTNGANNPTAKPSCTTCPTNKVMNSNDQCVVCKNGGCKNNKCNNGATNAPACNKCKATQDFYGGECVAKCPSGKVRIGGVCKVPPCSNGATNAPACDNVCADGSIKVNGVCPGNCTLINVCGQTVQGTVVNGVCTAVNGNQSNESCIVSFTTLNGGGVAPGGSAEFSWQVATLPSNVRQNCGFFDYTTPTPRPIPGLQNLDVTLNRTRITNIQNTTRFCLVCQFYNKTDNSLLGEAIKHQWIKVIRIGEN